MIQTLTQLSLSKDKFIQSKNLQTYFLNNQNSSPFYAKNGKNLNSKNCSSLKYIKNIAVYSSAVK